MEIWQNPALPSLAPWSQSFRWQCELETSFFRSSSRPNQELDRDFACLRFQCGHPTSSKGRPPGRRATAVPRERPGGQPVTTLALSLGCLSCTRAIIDARPSRVQNTPFAHSIDPSRTTAGRK